MAAAAPKARGLVGLFKQGLNEIPEVIGSTFIAVAGLGLAGAGAVNYYAKNGDNRRFKSQIVIFRSSDPRAATVRKD